MASTPLFSHHSLTISPSSPKASLSHPVAQAPGEMPQSPSYMAMK